MSEMVKKLVEEEGREARNIIMWNVLLDEKSQNEVLTSKKPPTSPNPRSASPKTATSGNPVENDPHPRKRCALYANCKGRVRSSSVGRSPQDDLRARYWTILFENLHRTVDEIYQTCETDESVVECKEAIMMLENYSKEFRSLIQWLNLNKDFENTPPPNRPTSLAWEVRKSSPGKGLLWNAFLDKYVLHEKKQEKSSSYMKSTSVQTDSINDVICLTVPSEVKSMKSGVETLDFGLGDIIQVDGVNIFEKEKNEATPIVEKKSEMSAIEKDSSLDDKNTTLLKENSIEERASADISENKCTSSTEVPSSIDKEASPMEPEIAVADVKIPTVTAESSSSPQVTVTKPVVTAPQEAMDKSTNKIGSSRLPSSTALAQNSQKTYSTAMAQSLRQPRVNSSSSITNRRKVDMVPNTSARRCVYSTKVQLNNNTKSILPLQPANQTVNKVTPSSSANKQTSVTTQSLKKNENLHGSSSSLSSTSSGKSWADKVRGSAQDQNKPLLKCSEEKNAKDDDESEGWETVRGRNRSRNSPAKRLGGTRMQAKSYPDIHMKDPADQYGSTLSLKSSQIKNTYSQSNVNSKETNVTSALKPVNGSEKKRTSYNSVRQSQQTGKMVKTTQMKTNNLRFQHREKREITPKISTGKCGSSNISKPQLRFDKNREASKENAKGIKEKINITQKMKSSSFNNKASNLLIPDEKSSTLQNEKMPEISNKTAVTAKLSQINQIELVNNAKNLENNTYSKSEKNDDSPKEKSEDTLVQKSSEQIKMSDADVSDTSDLDTLSCNSCDLINANISEDDVDCKECKQRNDEADELESDGDFIMGSDGHVTPSQDTVSGSESVEWDEAAAREEAQERIHKLGLSWADQMEHLDMELRPPGHALHMHEKLSSPYRKRSLSETIRRHEEKQIKAQEKRERLLEEKTQRFKDIAKKVEEMKAWKEQQQEKRRIIMEKKLRRAEEKRRLQLQQIIRKAHDEEEKVNEIAFINTLEAQNKRHDILSKEKDHEARLQDIQEERQRKLEEKAAKEAAAEERRKVLEAERQTRLLEMQERRKLRDMKIEQQLQEKEKERQELANQKARDREQRLSALNAAQQATLEELQKKIQQKQEESARRHLENMESIRQKAFELSVRHYSSNNDDAPRLIPYERKKMCTLCNVLIGSEVYLLSHLRGKKHQEAIKDQHQGKDPSTEELESYNLKHITDAPADQLDSNVALDKERQKALKKRCKKLRQRMTNRGMEYESASTNKVAATNSPHKQKLQKIIKELNKLFANQSRGPWDSVSVSALERSLGELERLFSKCDSENKSLFQTLGGLTVLMKLLSVISNCSTNKNPVIPNKSIIRAITVFGLACIDCPENCYNILFGNKIGVLLDYLIHCINILVPDNYVQLVATGQGTVTMSLPTDSIAGNLMQLLAIIITWLSQKQVDLNDVQNLPIDQNKTESQNEEFLQRVHDVISYTVSIGIVDKLSQYFNNVRGPIDSTPLVAEFLLQCMTFLSSLTKLFSNKYDNVFDSKKTEDTTQLIATFRVTELVGVVSLLYGMLLHGGAPSRGDTCPPQLPDHTINVTVASLCMLNNLALMDIQMTQSVLGSEGLSLQLRHIASYLLWYCSHWNTQELLHEVILLVGYFSALNPDNQIVIQSGQRPTVLQQLCSLPFQYFSDPQLTDILFPSLIACCHNNLHNKRILEQELSSELLANYIEAQLLDIHQANVLPSSKKGSNSIDQKPRWTLSSRFPKSYWTAAKQFFSNTKS